MLLMRLLSLIRSRMQNFLSKWSAHGRQDLHASQVEMGAFGVGSGALSARAADASNADQPRALRFDDVRRAAVSGFAIGTM